MRSPLVFMPRCGGFSLMSPRLMAQRSIQLIWLDTNHPLIKCGTVNRIGRPEEERQRIFQRLIIGASARSQGISKTVFKQSVSFTNIAAESLPITLLIRSSLIVACCKQVTTES